MQAILWIAMFIAVLFLAVAFFFVSLVWFIVSKCRNSQSVAVSKTLLFVSSVVLGLVVVVYVGLICLLCSAIAYM